MSESSRDPFGPTSAATTIWNGGTAVHDRADNVCVIGAGAAGLTAVKNLREYGFGVDCYERETGVGGAWNWRHDRSPVYASTHLISSKPFTQFPDFPMPDSWPDYPHHSQVLAYLERYADHFGLREHIWFGTEVTKVEPAEDGRWDVTISGARGGGADRTQRYAAVVVANGHNWSPKLPTYEGLDDFRRRGDPRLGVQGRGPAARHAGARGRGRQHRLRHRGRGGPAGGRGAGTPAGAATGTRRSTPTGARPTRSTTWCWRCALPLRLRQWLFQRTLRRTVGDLTRFGLPSAGPQGLRDAPDRQQPARLLPRPRRDHAGAGRRPVHPRQRGVHRRPDGRAGPGHPGHRLPAAVRVPRARNCSMWTPRAGRGCTCTRSRPAHPTLAVAGLLQPDSGRLLADALAGRRGRHLAAAARVRAGPGGRVLAPQHHQDASERYNKAKVKQSTRHWFEVSHVEYLRAIEKAAAARWRPRDEPAAGVPVAGVGLADPAGAARGAHLAAGPTTARRGRRQAAVAVRARATATAPGRSPSSGSSTRPSAGYPAYAMSLRGHGDSGAGPATTLRAYAHDVVQVAARLPRQAVLIGHGVGGLAVANALARYPARAGVLRGAGLRRPRHLAAALWPATRPAPCPAIFGAPLRLRRGQLFGRELPADAGPRATPTARRRGRAAGAVAAAALARARSAPVGDAPVLVVGSPDDRVVPRRSLEQVARRYGGAPLLFPGMGHDLMLDAPLAGADRRHPRLARQGVVSDDARLSAVRPSDGRRRDVAGRACLASVQP